MIIHWLIDWLSFPDGKNITNSNGECLGVKEQKVVEVECSKNDLSQRWLRVALFHILNMKTLKCLQWNNVLEELTIAQCKSYELAQHWLPNEEIVFNSTVSGSKRVLYSNFSEITNIYKGKSFIIIQLFKGSNTLRWSYWKHKCLNSFWGKDSKVF